MSLKFPPSPRFYFFFAFLCALCGQITFLLLLQFSNRTLLISSEHSLLVEVFFPLPKLFFGVKF